MDAASCSAGCGASRRRSEGVACDASTSWCTCRCQAGGCAGFRTCRLRPGLGLPACFDIRRRGQRVCCIEPMHQCRGPGTSVAPCLWRGSGCTPRLRRRAAATAVSPPSITRWQPWWRPSAGACGCGVEAVEAVVRVGQVHLCTGVGGNEGCAMKVHQDRDRGQGSAVQYIQGVPLLRQRQLPCTTVVSLWVPSVSQRRHRND